MVLLLEFYFSLRVQPEMALQTGLALFCRTSNRIVGYYSAKYQGNGKATTGMQIFGKNV